MNTSTIVVTSAVAAILVVGIGLGLYYTIPSLNASGTTSSQSLTNSYSVETSSTTSVATSANTMIRANTTSSFSTTSNSSTVTPVPTQGSFTYSPNSNVKILSVEAYTSQYGTENQSISFLINFENVGNDTIYVVRGGGSGLNATILSGNVKEVSTVRCDIAEAPSPVAPGSNSSVTTPGCWSGYNLVISQPGTIQVQLTLSWSYGQSSTQMSSDVITAEFNLN